MMIHSFLPEARSFTGEINTIATTTLLRFLGRSVVSTPKDEPSKGSALQRYLVLASRTDRLAIGS